MMCTKKQGSIETSATTPIEDLWTKLLSEGYLSSDKTKLDLPAENSLGSQAITTLLSDTELFPTAAIVMSLTSATPPDDNGSIVLIGTIDGKSFNLQNPKATATFSISGSANAQLCVSTEAPEESTVLGVAFPGLKSSDSSIFAASPAASTSFSSATFHASSSDDGILVTFSGQPVPGEFYKGMWKGLPAPMSGNITRWTISSDKSAPDFLLTSGNTDAVPTAGLLPMKAGIELVSSKEKNDTSHGTALFDAGSLQPSTVNLTFPILNSGTPLSVSSGNLDISLNSITDIASLLMGEAADACVPNRFPIGSGFKLLSIEFMLNYDANKTINAKATISVETNIQLLPLKMAALERVTFTFSLGTDLSGQVLINGLFKLNDNPELLFNGGLSFKVLDGGAAPGADSVTFFASNAKEIDVLQLLNIVPGIPALPKSGIVAETLAAQITPATGTYLFNGKIKPSGGQWTLEFGRGIKAVSLESLSLSLNRTPTNVTALITAETEFLGIPFTVSALTSTQSKSWIFEGLMTAEDPVHLNQIADQLLPFDCSDLPDVQLASLDAQFDTSANTFMVHTNLLWKLDILPISISADLLIQSQRAQSTDPAEYSGHLSGVVDINNMLLICSYVFSPTTTDITFAYRDLKVVYHKDDTDPYVAVSLDNSNVGDLFVFLLSFAQPGRNISLGDPWNALEKISLPNLTVKVHLKTKKIEVDMDLNIDLGFIKIDNFTLTYVRQYGKPKFSLELTCEFLGQKYGDGNEPLSWDPLNEQPPIVPGAGTQVFDLEYLGVGQRMSIRGDIPPTMDRVIQSLEKALVPVGNPTQNPANQLPGLAYDAGSDWMIGARFTVMSTFNLSVVFNDPRVYGLLIQLSGSRAGVLAGLRFEIMYRKISDDVGVYHIELTLPDEMRHLEFGEVSITLPVVTIDIFTNGNFRIDAGFPPSLTDFSRSFSVQVFPFIGYGGFYFGVLNGETSTTIPKITNGHFSPVIEFGLALQVGVGKTLSLGILSGGISITVGGMLQGTLSWFNPTDQALVPDDYFHLRGTLAVIGQVYATVDFGIIQASVSLTVYVSADVDMESYREILLSISAGVRVKVSIKIVFIRIHFSFSATITESFTIGSNRQTPWQLAAPESDNEVPRSLYRARRPFVRQRQYGQLRTRPARVMMSRRVLRRYEGRAGSSINVDVTAIPLFSQASANDFKFSGAPIPPKNNKNSVLAILLGLQTSTDATSGTNQLLTFISDWLSELIDDDHATLSAAVVDEILDALKEPSAASDIFSYGNLVHLFESHNIRFNLYPRPDKAPADGEELPMALMAMIPELSLDAPDYSINFLTDRIPSSGYEQQVQEYFADLAAQFVERSGWNDRTAPNTGNPDSMATLIFRYYFLMVARSLMQQTKSFMAEADWPLSKDLSANSSLSALANLINNDYTARPREDFSEIASFFGVTSRELENANPDFDRSGPAAGDLVFIPTTSVTYISQDGDNLNWLASCFGLSAGDIQNANPNVSFDPLASGTALAIPAMRILHKSLFGETIASISADFDLSVQSLRAANPGVDFNPLAAGTVLLIPLSVSPYAIAESNQKKTGKLRQDTVLQLGDIPFLTQSGNTLSGLAIQFGMDDLAFVQINQETRGLFRTAQKLSLGDLSYQTRNGDSFKGLLAYWYALNTDFSAKDLLQANPDINLAAPQTLLVPRLTENDNSVTIDHVEKLQDFLASNETTIDELLASNVSVALATGQTVQLKSVTVVANNSFILQYTATGTETPLSLAQQFFDPSGSAQAAALQSIRQWNGNVPVDHAFAAGTVVAVPYFTTIANISRQYEISIPDLCSKTTFLTDENLLAANIAMMAANVTHKVAENETFAEIAQNYDLSLEQLVNRISKVTGIFSDDADTIAINAIPGIRRSLLATTLVLTGNYTNAMNMSTRFMLNGLRLPDPNFQELNAVVEDTDTAYPLYALVGQEYPLVAPDPNKGYTLSLKGSGASWVNIPDDKLYISLLEEEINRITVFETETLDTSGIVSDAIPLFTYVMDRQTTAATSVWATEDIPGGVALSSQRVNTPRIWNMPDVLISALAESPGRMLPYQGSFATPLSDGSISTTALEAARYATAIDLTIQKPNDAHPGTYLLSGTDQAGLQRLLNLWTYLQTNPSVDGTVYLAYTAQNAQTSGGTQTTDRLDRSKSFLLKTNLSTESHGELQAMLRSSDVTMLNDGLVDNSLAMLSVADTRNFLQLVWECSIVKNGGYYLNYVKEDSAPGLPGTLFSDGQQAKLKLIVVLSNQTVEDCIALAFNNILIVGDNVDQSAHSTFFEALTHTVSSDDTLEKIASEAPAALNLTGQSLGEVNQLVMGLLRPGGVVSGQTVLRSDSISSIAQRAGKPVADIASELADETGVLELGAKLQLAGKPVQPVREGDTLASISLEYDFLDPAVLASLNANRKQLLATGATMVLPNGAIYEIQEGDTFASIAHAKQVDLSLLGDLNAITMILAPNATITVAGNTLKLSASLPPGHAGFTISRSNPEVAGVSETAASALSTLYNLAGFQLLGNDILNASNEGLPAGPTNDVEDAVWDYRQIMSILSFAKSNSAIVNVHLPPVGENPYSAVSAAGQADIALNLQDILGNRTTGSDLSSANSDTGYTDELVGLGAWPSVNACYRFEPADGKGALRVTAQLSPTQFLPDASAVRMPGGLPSGFSLTTAATRAGKACLQYQTVSYQLQQSDITVRLSTTLGELENGSALGSSIHYDLLGIANSAYIFMGIAEKITTTTVALGPETNIKNFVDLLNHEPATPEMIGKVNSFARADLLFAEHARLNIPKNTITKSGDTPQAVVNRLNNEVELSSLAKNNQTLGVAQDTAFKTASRTVTLDVAGQSLNALAMSFGCSVATTAGSVPGLAVSSQKVTLGKNVCLTYTDPVSGKTYTYGPEVGTDRSLETAASYFSARIDLVNKTDVVGVTIDDVAMANLYLNGIFEVGQTLVIESVVAHSGDSIESLINDFGAPDAGQSDPVSNFITVNANVPNVWPIGTALFVKDEQIAVEEGQTLNDLAQSALISVGQVISNNLQVSFNSNASLIIPYSGDNSAIVAGAVVIGNNQSLSELAASLQVEGSDILKLNGNIPALFSGSAIGGVTPTLQDTPNSVAKLLGTTLEELADTIADNSSALRAGATLVTDQVLSLDAESIQSLATRLNSTPAAIVATNACLPSLVQSGQKVSIDDTQYTVEENDTLGLFLARINGERAANKAVLLSVADFAAAAKDLTLVARSVITPVVALDILAPVTPHFGQAILNLGVNLSVSRDPAMTARGFENAPRVISSNSSITAAPFAASAQNDKKSLEQFATDFEAAFTGLKVATGPKLTQGKSMLKQASMRVAVANSATATKDKSIWIANFSDQGACINYGIVDDSARYFGLPPLTTVAWNGTADEVAYDSNAGLKWTQSQSEFRAADPDQWQQQLFSAIDLVLSPEYAVAGSSNTQTRAAIQTIISAKGKIANGLANTVQPIVAGDINGQADAVEAMEQQLLVELSGAYTIQSLIQLDVNVTGDGSSPAADIATAPQLAGKLAAEVVNTGGVSVSPLTDGDNENPLAPLAGITKVSQQYLALVIADTRNIIQAGLTIGLKGGSGKTHATSASDTLRTVADAFELTLFELAEQMVIVGSSTPLFRTGVAVNVTPTVAPGDLSTVTAVADWANVEISEVIMANLNRTDFFVAGSSITLGEHSVTPKDTDTLEFVANDFGGIMDFASQLGSVDAGSLNGSYQLNTNEPPHGLVLIPQMSLSTAKAALANGGSRLTTAFCVKDPSVQRSVTLNLNYHVNQLEFDRHGIEGVHGYQDSSWLSFVIPLNNAGNTNGKVGQLQIPVPLRGYPEPAIVSKQVASPAYPSDDKVATLAQWDYDFTAARQFAAQDQMTLEVLFNHPEGKVNSSLVSDERFDAIIRLLASFSTVWGEMSPDLALLKEVTSEAVPTPAANALNGLASIVEKVGDAWESLKILAKEDVLPERRYIYQMSILTKGVPAYISSISFERLEQSVDFSTNPDDFVFTCSDSFAGDLDKETIPPDLSKLFADYGFNLGGEGRVSVGNKGSDWMIFAPQALQTFAEGKRVTAPQTFRLQRHSSDNAIMVSRQILWPGIEVADNGNKPQWLDSRQMGTRLVFDLPEEKFPLAGVLALPLEFYRLNVMGLQDAWGGTSISRNANLLAGESINPDFVYQTPLTVFPTRISPLISETAIATLKGDTLEDALSTLFKTLTAGQAAILGPSERKMRITATYWAAADPSKDPAETPLRHSTPLTLSPLYAFEVTSDWKEGNYTARLAQQMQQQAVALGVSPQAPGRWVVDVLVYSYQDSDSAKALTALLDVRNKTFKVN